MAEKVRNQFARDAMRSVEKRLSSFGKVTWPFNEYLKVEAKQDFTGRINSKPFRVKNSNTGPVWIEFDGIRLSFEKVGTSNKTNMTIPESVKESQQKPKKKTTSKKEKPPVEMPKQEKPRMKPNYAMMANDWINENLAALNAACNDSMANNENSDILVALLSKDILPPDIEFWKAIADAFVEQGEIDKYEIISDNGIKVYISL